MNITIQFRFLSLLIETLTK